MPHGQKSKLHARQKCQRTRIETQGLKGAEASAAKVEGSPSSSSVLGNTSQSSPAVRILQECKKDPVTATTIAAILARKSNGGAKSQQEKNPSTDNEETLYMNSKKDPLSLKVSLLVEFMIDKYKNKEPIMKTEMLQLLNENYEDQFPEILRRAKDRMELIFGLELKEDSPNSNSCHFVSMLNIAKGRSLTGGSSLPNTGLAMTLLGIIFMNGNRVSEDELWEFLGLLDIYAGKVHSIFGEPRKFITKDLVMERFLKRDIMPRGQKSKLRAREKRQRARIETQDLQGAEASATKVEGSPSPSSVLGNTPQSSPVAHILQECKKGPVTATTIAAILARKSNGDAKSQQEKNPSTDNEESFYMNSKKDPLSLKVSPLVEFMIDKYKNKEPIMKTEMLQLLNENHEEQFPEILRRAKDRMELIFGLELKEDSPNSNSCHFVSMLNIAKGRSLTGGSGLPKTGLAMTLLCIIFMNGNRATEDELWEFLGLLGIYAGKVHSIFGDPRKFITKDLVMEGYLVFRKVPKSDPPCNEFLWGPRAYAETTKMKALQVLAKINNTVPSSFPALYEEALRDEEERAQARAVNARAGARSRGK
ncbi:PREDICTED: melanoma-associated antigen B4-like [Chrysochloris asiatica]|uniref:Melanoma-associated antigen B4-like n=1 Tax=Chrysochloris asiatica TaxID=185453 RepID=A0A9B0T5D8_CHRAS|nr:PREDICTED: melanoma-associated antigen B4-like [Chrysochloris asiatica]